jgi:lipopolysaccharide biosynthesis glycosyltransferase
MTSRFVVCSMAEGKEFEQLSQVSFRSIKQYAHRIGADFSQIRGRQFPSLHISWEKIRAADLLWDYERVMLIDADAIIKDTAPSLFEIVPEYSFAAFDEGKHMDREGEMVNGAKAMNIVLEAPDKRAFRYFNIGVMVFSRIHSDVFRIPGKLLETWWPDQTYINLAILSRGFRFYDLTTRFNGLHCLLSEEKDREKVDILHYAGWPRTPGWVQELSTLMEVDTARWKKSCL